MTLVSLIISRGSVLETKNPLGPGSIGDPLGLIVGVKPCGFFIFPKLICCIDEDCALVFLSGRV